jgi:hypothetical protein
MTQASIVVCPESLLLEYTEGHDNIMKLTHLTVSCKQRKNLKCCVSEHSKSMGTVNFSTFHLCLLLKKGDITKCNNWRSITLLSAPSKILSRVILNTVKGVVEVLRKEQSGSRKHRSCVDLINTFRTILEQSAEWQTTLYLTFFLF